MSNNSIPKLFIFVFLSGLVSLRAEPMGVKFDLVSVVKRVLEKSPDIQKAHLALESNRLEEPLLLSELDTRIEAGVSRLDDQSPRVAPAFEGTRSERDQFDVSLVQKTLLGTEARLVWDNNKLKNPSQFRELDPSAESNLSLQVRQPLLRYFWGRPDIARRRRFRSHVFAAESRLEQMRQNAALRAARAYFELYFSEERVRINQSSVKDAERLLRNTMDKRRYGLVEDSDLLQAKVSLEAEETELRLAASDSERAEAALRELLVAEEFDDIHISTPNFSDSSNENISTLQEALQNGFAQRGDMKSVIAEREAAEWAVRSEKLDTLPDLAFIGSYGAGGLGSTYSKAWDDLGGFDHPVKSLGLDLTLPLGFKKERLQRKSKQLLFEMAQQQEIETQELVRKEIKDAWENWTLQKSRRQARQRLLELQEKKLKAELANFERGRSTTDVVVRFQQDLRRAELDLSRTKIEEALARLEFGRSTGQLFNYVELSETP